MRITQELDLPNLSAEIHDAWLDVDRVDYDQARKVLRIPLSQAEERGPLRSVVARAPKKDSMTRTLSIANVLAFKVQDSEGIGFYDINEIAFDVNKRIVTMKTNIPLVFEIEVSALEITLTRTPD